MYLNLCLREIGSGDINLNFAKVLLFCDHISYRHEVNKIRTDCVIIRVRNLHVAASLGKLRAAPDQYRAELPVNHSVAVLWPRRRRWLDLLYGAI